MFDWLLDIISGAGKAIGADFGSPSKPLPAIRIPFPRIFRGRPSDPSDDPAGPTLEQILQERRFRNVPETTEEDRTINVPLDDAGNIIFEDISPADFEPDLGVIERESGTAEDVEDEEETMALGIIPILGSVAGAAARGIGAGVAFGTGVEILGQFAGLLGTTDAGGTSTAVPAPATTSGTAGAGVEGGNGLTVPSISPGGLTIAQTRAGILKGIGAQHGRRSFSYNVARRILKDLGEEAGARCLGITAGAACFLLIHPPKRRGRQITPKQINRAMGAYKRVRALNKSVRKTLGPGCKL